MARGPWGPTMGELDSSGGRQEVVSYSVSKGAPKQKDANGGFARAISTLQKLNRLESDIATLISSCKVPVKETRKFLRCTTPSEASNVALFQYMKALFMQLGIDLEISSIRPFSYTFSVRDSAISDLCSGIRGRTCELVSEAISRFFRRELNLNCRVEEIGCLNAGDSSCKFETRIGKEDFCRVVLSDIEKSILEELSKPCGGKHPEKLYSSMSEEELDFRLSLLKRFELVGEEGKLTELGARLSSSAVEKDDLTPPWKEISELATAISNALSFAEATRYSLTTSSNDDSKEGPLLNSKEVRECRSFAELLAKRMERI